MDAHPMKDEAAHHSPQMMAEEIAREATAFQQQRTGHEPRSVSVVFGGDTVVVTMHGALSPAELAMGQSAEGAAKVREFHRQLFLADAGTIRQKIKRITGMEVREASADVDPTCGAVIHVFTSGTMVQVFLLSGKVPSGSFNAKIARTDVSGHNAM